MPMHSPDHGINQSIHSDLQSGTNKRLLWAFLINLFFLIAEVIGGVISGSMALLADAGHMLSDVVSLGTALWVAHAMRKPASSKRTYGYGRLEVLSGLINGLILWGVVLFIVIESIKRLLNPQDIDVTTMLIIGILGLIANIGSAAVLFNSRKVDLNLKQAFLHLLADAAGSVGVVLAGFGVLIGGWIWMDTIASIIIALLILTSSLSLIRESIHIILEGTPPNIDMTEIRQSLEHLPEVREVHDLHAWLIGSRDPMLTAHIVCLTGSDVAQILQTSKSIIKKQTKIEHITIQIEDEKCHNFHT